MFIFAPAKVGARRYWKYSRVQIYLRFIDSELHRKVAVADDSNKENTVPFFSPKRDNSQRTVTLISGSHPDLNCIDPSTVSVLNSTILLIFL
jgi:hypothetical protein